MKEKLRHFMIGRYGVDQLNRCLILFSMVMLVIDLFTRNVLLSLFSMAILVFCYFRMFSRNKGKRYAENEKFLKLQYYLQDCVKRLKFKLSQSKTYHIYKCPGCGQKIRIPKGKGKISVHCPKCGMDFIKKS